MAEFKGDAAGEENKSGLRRHVVDGWRFRDEGIDRGDIDDASTAVVDHVLGGYLAGEEWS